MPDSADFGDIGVNTLGHISESVETFQIPNLQKLGMANIIPLKQVAPVEKPLGYYGKLREKSRGKDTMTGHWEMMGLEVTKPFQTFTETGFPPELIKELEERTGLHVVLWDERRTTVSAAAILADNDTFGAKRKERLDSVSAAVILESFLNWRAHHPDEEPPELVRPEA